MPQSCPSPILVAQNACNMGGEKNVLLVTLECDCLLCISGWILLEKHQVKHMDGQTLNGVEKTFFLNEFCFENK